jgi:hypothetical protein
MPISKVKIGRAPDDGAGDTLRDAFAKLNESLDELASAVAARLTTRPHFAARQHEHVGYVTRYVRSGPPDEPPELLGAVWVDADDGAIYLATGAEHVSDWRKVAFAGPVA